MFRDAYEVSNRLKANFSPPFERHVAGGHGNGHCGLGIIHIPWQVNGSSLSPGEKFGVGFRDWICSPAFLAGVHYQIPLLTNARRALLNNGI